MRSLIIILLSLTSPYGFAHQDPDDHPEFNQCERLELQIADLASEGHSIDNSTDLKVLKKTYSSSCTQSNFSEEDQSLHIASLLQNIETGKDDNSCTAKLVEKSGRCQISTTYNYPEGAKSFEAYYDANDDRSCQKICDDRRKGWDEEDRLNSNDPQAKKMAATQRTCRAKVLHKPKKNVFCVVKQGSDGVFALPAGPSLLKNPAKGSLQHSCKTEIMCKESKAEQANGFFAKAKIVNPYRKAHRQCASGCRYVSWGVWGDKKHQARRSCHNSGEAIDIHAIKCGRTHKARSNRFDNYVSCMRKKFKAIYRSKNHYNHAHFQFRNCRRVKGRRR